MADFYKNLRASLFNDDLSNEPNSAGSISLDSTFKHFVDGSFPVKRVPDDQNSLAALHCLPLRDQQNFTLLRDRQLRIGKIICQFDPQNY